MVKFSMDAEKLYKNLQRSITLSKDARPLLMLIRGKFGDQNPLTLIGGIQTNFIKQGTDLYRWPDLSEKYAKRKAKKYPGKSMLIASGDMFDSLVNGKDGAVNILTKLRLEYGSTLPTVYWHMKGTPKMPKRPPMAVTRKQVTTWKTMIRDYFKETMEGAR